MAKDVNAEEHVELTPTEARGGFRGADVLAMLAVSTLLAAVALASFFVTTNMTPGS